MDVDVKRIGPDESFHTGIYVRAKVGARWESVDISVLTKEALLKWLKSNGGDNIVAEDVVGILLGHGHLHEKKGG